MKTVVITGSTRGIGLGLASELLARECNVVISGRSKEAVDRASATLAEKYPAERLLGHPCDVTDAAQVQALWDASAARFGRIDIWINNAGISNSRHLLWEQTPDQVAIPITTNLLGTIYGCQVAMNGMIAQGGGHIYNMKGYGSKGQFMDGNLPYTVTKYAITYLSEALIREAKNTPVKISTISPGMLATDLLVAGIEPGRKVESQRIFNILADQVETVTPWLAERILSNDEGGRSIAWLTRSRIMWRFLTAPFRKRTITLPPGQH